MISVRGVANGTGQAASEVTQCLVPGVSAGHAHPVVNLLGPVEADLRLGDAVQGGVALVVALIGL